MMNEPPLQARWLLDTCAISELSKPHPDEGLRQWLMQYADQCVLSSASLGEIHYGIACLPTGAKRNQLYAWANLLAQQFSGRIMSTDDNTWKCFGELKASLRAMGRMQDALDIVIAATAMAHGLTLVTRNTRHFTDTGIALINPCKP